MKVVTVIPLSKGVFRDHLTYFTTANLTPGALVTVPVRQGETDALVVEVKDASSVKSSLKKEDFSLKKITQIKQDHFFQPDFIKACQKSASYFLAPTGHIIKEFTPKIILENYSLIHSQPVFAKSNNLPNNSNIITEKYALQDDNNERLGFYKRTIREAFAQKKSVFICFPSSLDIDQIKSELSKGIEDHTFTLHNKLTQTDLIANWNKALANQKPIVILGTSLFLALPRADIKIFIIDQERSPYYKHLQRPFIDARVFIEHLAEATNGKLILGDSLLRTETIHKINEHTYLPTSIIKQRNKGQAESLVIVPPKKNNTDPTANIFSEELLSMIDYSIANNNRLVIISGRRGLYPITICNDCGTVVTCDQCTNPVSIHKTDEGAAFMCHRCGSIKPAEDKCIYCGGWRLALLGTGTEKIAETINHLFPATPMFKVDSDSVTPKKAKEEIKKFLATKGSVLIGTEMILHYLKEPLEYSALLSIDSLFAIPDFRINEKILNLVIETHKLATKHFIIQTRLIDHQLFNQALTGNLSDFFRNELEERQLLNYPPFSKLIKVSCSGSKQTVLNSINHLATDLKKYKPLVIPNLEAHHSHYRASLILKLPMTPLDPDLLNILSSLPPAWLIDVDPESIL
ncbi:MAG: primosomal protein N' [Candidatus Vogelbacteria bacterium]|nr:primosomal protein N' [Candidatus Vogelbacteria bacterium]